MSGEPVFTLIRGTQPLLISMPHVGTQLPADAPQRYTAKALTLADTDWHLPQLYAFARELGASLLIAHYSRYVIDLNRPPDDQNLYPGQNTTGLCPVDDFDSEALYPAGGTPTTTEIAERRETYWQPYHQALQAELARLRTRHPKVALWDAHSIRSRVPRFFDGQLPDLNLGTNNGLSCDPALAAQLLAQCQQRGEFSAVLNGRFKGGYITRQYGQPDAGIHAIQLEMAQCCYMQEQLPFAYLEARAVRVQPVLRQLLQIVLTAMAG